MGTPASAIVKPTLRDVHAYTGRNGGPEQWDNFAFAELQTRNVPKPVPLAQPLMAFQFEWKGRIVIGTANYTSVNPESLLNLFNRIKWTGQHVTLSSQTPWDGPGASLFKLMKLANVKGNDLYINGVRVSDDQISNGIPTATFGNTGTYDIDLIMTVPMYPLGLNDAQAIMFFYNEQAWGSTINMVIQMGDRTSFGVPAGGTTVTYTAFGLGTGTPQVNVNVVYAYLGPLAARIGQAVCIRSDQTINSVLQSNGPTTRLALLQNQRTQYVVLKTGQLAAGASPGVVAFSTLSDTITEQALLRKNNVRLRDLFNNSSTKAWYGYRMNTTQPIGYLGLFFDDGDPALNFFASYQGDNPRVLPAGAQFDIAAQIVGANAANAGEVIQEYTLGDPKVNLS